MRMARVNVYLPDELAKQARDAGLNVSGLAQDALRRALAGEETDRWLDQLDHLPRAEVKHKAVLDALDEAREELGARD